MSDAKTCSKCSESKSLSEFYRRGGPASSRRHSQCKICMLSYYNSRNDEFSKNDRRCNYCHVFKRSSEFGRGKTFCKPCHKSRRQLATYGLRRGEHARLLSSQGDRCAICASRKPHSKNGWATDHSHVTGNVRGILCNTCNVRLAHAVGDEYAPAAELVPVFKKHGMHSKLPLDRMLKYLKRAQDCTHEIAAQSGYCVLCIGKPL